MRAGAFVKKEDKEIGVPFKVSLKQGAKSSRESRTSLQRGGASPSGEDSMCHLIQSISEVGQ